MDVPDEVADFVAERARRDPKVRELIEDVRAFDGLKEHAGWRRLYKKIVGKEDKLLASLTRRLMAGEVVSQREIDWYRGFFAGAKTVLEQPEKADANLESAARQAWALAQLELTAEGDEEPYG